MDDLEYFDLLQHALSVIMKCKLITYEQLNLDLIRSFNNGISDESLIRLLEELKSIKWISIYRKNGRLFITTSLTSDVSQLDEKGEDI